MLKYKYTQRVFHIEHTYLVSPPGRKIPSPVAQILPAYLATPASLPTPGQLCQLCAESHSMIPHSLASLTFQIHIGGEGSLDCL